MSTTAQVHTVQSTGGVLVISRHTKSACTLCHRSLPERAADLLGPAAVREDGAAAARRVAVGLDDLHAVLPGGAARRLRLRPRRHPRARPASSRAVARRPRLATAVAAADCRQSGSRRRGRPADRVAAADHERERRSAVRGAGFDRAAASTLVLITRQTRSADPYWLYSASNIGSFAALLAFPILFEPAIPLGQQTAIWKIGYVVVAALLTACAVSVLRQLVDDPTSRCRRMRRSLLNRSPRPPVCDG